MNRLALYVFWERNGDVHDHVAYYLRSLFEVARDVTVIVNGTLSEQGKLRLKKLGVDFFVRENKGIDFAAWQAALKRVGEETLSRYDELVLCNSSCYGPMYPFSDMFRVMEERKCDFWGINRQPETPEKVLGNADAPFTMKEHIQSYFYVFRKNVIRSEAFRNWWRNLVPAEGYWEEVRKHEMAFSGYLEAHGFRGDTFMNADKYRKLAPPGGCMEPVRGRTACGRQKPARQTQGTVCPDGSFAPDMGAHTLSYILSRGISSGRLSEKGRILPVAYHQVPSHDAAYLGGKEKAIQHKGKEGAFFIVPAS